MSIDYYPPFEADKYYHVYNQGNNGERIFYAAGNYNFFLNRLSKYKINSFELLSYVLMPNHFHLLIRVTSPNPEYVSEQFRKFFMSYSKAINKAIGRKGSLFRKNVKRKQIGTIGYLKQTVLYIHRNPMHHNYTDNFQMYPYSSYNEVLRSESSLILREEVLEWFDDIDNYKFCHQSPTGTEKSEWDQEEDLLLK